MLKYCTVSLSALIVGATVGSAATDTGQYATYAIGAQNCSALLDAYQNAEQDAVLLEVSSWLSGYISGVNRLEESTYDVTPIMNHAALALLTLRVCENNPDQLYESVVSATIEEFELLRVREEVGGVQLESQGRTVMLREPAIKLLQTILADEGYLEAEAADGVFGSQTSEAITEWQKSEARTETGIFDPITVFGLLQTAD